MVEELEASVPKPSHAAFISYASSNRDQVVPIVASVEAGGIDLWFDRDGLKPGTNRAGTIVRAIKSSERFCLMCSAQSFASDHVRREVYLADKYQKPILPVRLDDALMPEDIEYFLIDRQWLDLTGKDHESSAEELSGLLKA